MKVFRVSGPHLLPESRSDWLELQSPALRRRQSELGLGKRVRARRWQPFSQQRNFYNDTIYLIMTSLFFVHVLPMGKKSNRQTLLLVFSMTSLVAAYFWMFGSVDHESPVVNAISTHVVFFEKLEEFDVPVSVSNVPSNYKATIKVSTSILVVSLNKASCFLP